MFCLDPFAKAIYSFLLLSLYKPTTHLGGAQGTDVLKLLASLGGLSTGPRQLEVVTESLCPGSEPRSQRHGAPKVYLEGELRAHRSSAGIQTQHPDESAAELNQGCEGDELCL